eukprot:105705-Amphidinium_carterae.1
MGTKAAVRELFFEAYSTLAADITIRADQSDDVTVQKKMPRAEREHRLAELKGRLKGLSITKHREPAHTVVDAYNSMLDSGTLRWLPWEEIISREAEALHMRKEVHLVVDAQGVWKPRTSPSFTAD